MRIVSFVLCSLLLTGCGPRVASVAEELVTRVGIAKSLFGIETTASSGAPDPLGFYTNGCIAGAEQLAETGATWQAMRLSRNRNWGHPETIDFIERLSKKAAQLPGREGLYVGDISQPRGGPMTSGHRSHQMGLDADIWLVAPKRLDLTRTERENLSATSMRRAGGAYTNSNWNEGHHALLKAAAQDPRVARIFIFPGAKVAMCNAEKGDRAWLNKIRPWYGHHYHFHVRLKCPAGAKWCEDQAPQPTGDGCADAEQWVRDILNPPPPKPVDPNAPKPQPRRDLTMADLPQKCSNVLSPPR